MEVKKIDVKSIRDVGGCTEYTRAVPCIVTASSGISTLVPSISCPKKPSAQRTPCPSNKQPPLPTHPASIIYLMHCSISADATESLMMAGKGEGALLRMIGKYD